MASSQKLPLKNADDKGTTYGSPDAIFSMYIDRVTKFEDEKNVENWKGGADSILVFTGVFSSTVATFIALSYPNLQQDPNITTQLLLAQISQQLSNTTAGGASGPVDPPVKSSYVPPTSVVFINSVWFLSLVLSLTCALMATLLQQWARRYLQIVQGKRAPFHHARIHVFFSGGVRKFGISKFVELLPLLLHLSVFLFFAGLVVFAFRGNHTVACFALTIVGFCALLYIAFTLMPLFYDTCPYQTPLTPVIRFPAQIIFLAFLSMAYHVTRNWYNIWGYYDRQKHEVVKSFRDRQQYWTRSLSENIVSRLENSTAPLSIDMYNNMLVRTIHWLDEDDELEEFVAGIPGLYQSEAFTDNDAKRNFRTIFAALPGLMGSRSSLPWNIVQLAQKASTGNLPQLIYHRRTRACLKALYYIPGAIRDVLAPYAVEKNHSSKILPLLNSPESLEVINELQDMSNDFAIPARCVAAVVATYMITPSHPTTSNDIFIGDHESGKDFLGKRLGVDANADDGVNPTHRHRSDSARLQNIVRFLKNIEVMLGELNKQWWTSKDRVLIRREHMELVAGRYAHMEEYRTSHGKLDQLPEGNRKSPAFVPAAKLDLITLTLDILVRDPVTDATESQREALWDAYREFENVAFIQAKENVIAQRLAQRAWIEAQATDGVETVKGALQRLFPQTNTVQAADHVAIELPA